MRSIVAAKVTVVMVRPARVTSILSMWKSAAIGFRFAVTIRPPAPTATNIRYMSQKIGCLSTSPGL